MAARHNFGTRCRDPTHITLIRGGLPMRLSSAIRAVLIALTVTGGFGSAAYADAGRIRFNVIKAGFVIGGSAGSGTLLFHGRRYPFSIGGGGYGVFFCDRGDRFVRHARQSPMAAGV